MKLLIAIPTKSTQHYLDRAKACKETWLKDCPCDYKFFSDADLGLTETTGQHDNANDPIRTWRTKLMVKYAFENGYDYIFRVDTDAYVWVNRLLASGFEQWDYSGWCNPPRPILSKWCMTTAHGGIGFFLSRKAMEIVMNAPVDKYADGKYWGDLWAGQKLHEAGIECHRDTRFIDGSAMPHIEELKARLDRLSNEKTKIAIQRAGIRAAGKVLIAAQKDAAPYETGKLVDSIGMSVRKANGKLVAMIGADKHVNFIGRFHEFGTKFMSGEHWTQKSFDASAHEALDAYTAAVLRLLDKHEYDDLMAAIEAAANASQGEK